MSPEYLIDVNLPHYFSFWNNGNFTHQLDIGRTASDTDIWAWSKERHMTIVTKDSDFSNRILLSNPPPSIIHFRTGNLSMKVFIHWFRPSGRKLKYLARIISR